MLAWWRGHRRRPRGHQPSEGADRGRVRGGDSASGRIFCGACRTRDSVAPALEERHRHVSARSPGLEEGEHGREKSDTPLYRFVAVEVKYRWNPDDLMRRPAPQELADAYQQWPDFRVVLVTDHPPEDRSCFQVVRWNNAGVAERRGEREMIALRARGDGATVRRVRLVDPHRRFHQARQLRIVWARLELDAQAVARRLARAARAGQTRLGRAGLSGLRALRRLGGGLASLRPRRGRELSHDRFRRFRL